MPSLKAVYSGVCLYLMRAVFALHNSFLCYN